MNFDGTALFDAAINFDAGETAVAQILVPPLAARLANAGVTFVSLANPGVTSIVLD